MKSGFSRRLTYIRDIHAFTMFKQPIYEFFNSYAATFVVFLLKGLTIRNDKNTISRYFTSMRDIGRSRRRE